MTDDKLLPLPDAGMIESEGEFVYGYDRDDMHAYTRANIAERDAEIARLRERAERLEAALRPFAALYQPDALCAHSDDQPDSRGVYGINAANITLGDLRRARAAIADGESASA